MLLTIVLAYILSRLANLLAAFNALLATIDIGIALDALLLALRPFETLSLALDALLLALGALGLTLDALLLALDSLRTFLALDLAFDPLRALDALLTLHALRPFGTLHLALHALRTLNTLNQLALLALRALGALGLLGLLALGALRALGALGLLPTLATAATLGLRLLAALIVALLGERRDGQSHAGNTGDQYHLAGHERPPILGFLNQNNAPHWHLEPVQDVNLVAFSFRPSRPRHRSPSLLSGVQEWQ